MPVGTVGVPSNLMKVYIKSGSYVEIAVNSITPGENTKRIDLTHRDAKDGDGNNLTHERAIRRQRTWDLEGDYLIDKSDDSRDPGQVLVDTLARKTYPDDLGEFKFETPDGDTVELWCFVEGGNLGGGTMDEKAGWSCTIVESLEDETPA